ncbi:putative acyl-CoA dehydrogenase [Trypanosoma rangeli]|uniref:Putative acyl-CoA dehydrogenase n=1 Tax=Trypanosoma rangeli TaxID=5698 RepID=A0A422NKY7_TRYRA|nr:putative acyl-CoA dehydrogenase [Trypanosoma rangeli]RNF05999.1 putative acyl-CoA dehydrogenase [Trypanosoma rangeli]|eukprot:RNF05999.1 putative acyl-CoA dehydrogenase [Trypanosoma rangeli]
MFCRRFYGATKGVTNALCVAASMRCLHYVPRIRDIQFLMEDVFDMYLHYEKLGRADVNKELFDGLLEKASKLATHTLFPLYTSSDDEGCHLLEDGTVRTPKGFKEAYEVFKKGGWVGISFPEEYGGQGLPGSVGFTVRELMATANWPFAMYSGLSMGAANTLLTWGSEEQKKTYLTKLVSGDWTGTMCLTEPQCGTDLAQVGTKAEPCSDGTYKLRGTKIFISAGEHDMTENIIHVVVARLPDSVSTTKDISLFLVPRNLVKPDGSLDPKKNVQCVGLESKMGIKGNATAQLSFEDSVGYLIGQPNKGVKEMPTFLNAARVGASLQGICHAELAFQNALKYARERGSQRSLSGTKCPDRANDLLVWHPNVRQNILFAKVIAEGGRAFLMDVDRLRDIQEVTKDAAKRIALEHEIDFYTPIAKGCLTEWGLEASSRCLQVWGGHGYIKGNGMEQILRDARIATLYEGTTGIQSLDFIDRKVLHSKTDEVARFSGKVNALARSHFFSRGPIGKFSRRLWTFQKQWRLAITKVRMCALSDIDSVGAASEDMLMCTGYLVLGYYWLRMAIAAEKKVAADQDPDGFYQCKLDLCQFFFQNLLPRADAHFQVVQTGSDVVKGNEAAWDLA